MKGIALILLAFLSFNILAGGGINDGPIKKHQSNKDQKPSKYLSKDEDCDRCEGEEGHHRLMKLLKTEHERYLESLAKEIQKGAI